MDSLEYHQIITEILQEYAKLPYAHGNLERKLIIGEDHKSYALFTVGQLNNKQVHGCVLHLEIIGDKVWIHQDGLEDGIADELLNAGIPQEKIVLGFHHPDLRPYTGFAIG